MCYFNVPRAFAETVLKVPAMKDADEQPFTTPTHPPGSRATGHSRGAHGDRTDDFLQNRYPVTQASMGSRLPLKVSKLLGQQQHVDHDEGRLDKPVPLSVPSV